MTKSRAYELDRAHVFHSWSAQRKLDPMVVDRAEGSYVWDDEGKRYLDFTSQLVFTNIGHQHPKVVKAIQDQAAKLCTIAPATANEARSEAARLIAEIAPGDMQYTFFTNAGAEAIEHAIRMARLHTGRIKVLSRYRSYHGGTQTALNATGDPRRWASDYGNAGIVHFRGPFLYRSEFHATTEQEECERALAHLRSTIELEGPATIAAIVLETVPGTAGIMPPPQGYLQGVRALCDEFGIVYIADEVMAGFGRTGKWLAIDEYGVEPDLITFAKGITSGYVPLGGVIVGPKVFESFAEKPYPGGLTYSGHPLACATAVATVNVMREEGMVENAARIGEEIIKPRLEKMVGDHACLGEVRGLGAFWALELVRDKETREPLAPYGGSSPAMDAVVAECKKNGLLPFVNYNRIHVVPALNIPDEQLQEGLETLDAALSVGDAHAQS
ncbi:aspartate aminotransferase family protein [Yimella sp. cx-51]|uniref:aspartate aminotransferase family protein n=1 Tax=Yimella sp. cx-51 TaxID=2770551 RepID=UPI00165E37D3|nr:aspartate aminotransferase family protein [Yimella sp. cx-51]MBC9957152.1 aspartate aminotransferase family protein [Yimella sp. cx-51]QTH37198.1 aspartate aminotransferase family protein [Yimella sp. cx-51]